MNSTIFSPFNSNVIAGSLVGGAVGLPLDAYMGWGHPLVTATATSGLGGLIGAWASPAEHLHDNVKVRDLDAYFRAYMAERQYKQPPLDPNMIYQQDTRRLLTPTR